jgi:hypothetical protein
MGTKGNNFTDGTVMKMPLGRGAPINLASGQNSPGKIAVDATSIYWTNGAGGTVNGSVMKLSPK